MQHRVLMVSDFFYPNCGGVENHIYQLGQCLIDQGHKVVVLTHAYGDCAGVRYLSNGLKVYYVYRLPVYLQSTFPTLLGSMHLLRLICVRERISLLHAHQAFSTMGLEACLGARCMGLKVVFTDHSLFGFADAASILMNKVLKCVLADVHHVICVSHTSKENTVLRACLPPHRVSVIPNAVNADDFTPAAACGPPGPGTPGPGPPGSSSPGPWPPGPCWPCDPARDPVTVIALSRLVYRKGIDLLALVIPHVCRTHPLVNFIIGGDGPKRLLLEAMVAERGLQGRVKLVGSVPPEGVRDFLAQGHLFLNTSLTEAFCMAIVEAACVGLTIVSTRVGGVPEVLPPHMIVLAEPSAEGLCAAVEQALLRLPLASPQRQHQQVREMYSWADVAARTVRVYGAAAASPRDDALLARLARYGACGPLAGAAFASLALLGALYCRWLEWWRPAAGVDLAPDWPRLPCAEGGQERHAAGDVDVDGDVAQ